MGVVATNVQPFRDLRRQVSQAAREAMMPELRQRLRAALLKLVMDGFRLAVDPYGKPWAPVVRNRRRDRRARGRRAAAGQPAKADKPLIDTGRMRASATAVVEGDAIRVLIPVEYASYHQDPKPGSHNVQRAMIPDARGIPPKWLAVTNKEALDVMRKFFGPAVR